MGVQKQSVSFTEAAFAYARELVDQGEYPTISAAVSGELAGHGGRGRETQRFSKPRSNAGSNCPLTVGSQ